MNEEVINITISRLKEHAKNVAGVIPKQDIQSGVELIESLREENARLRKLVEKAFSYGYWSNGVSKQTSWEQFKRDNGI